MFKLETPIKTPLSTSSVFWNNIVTQLSLANSMADISLVVTKAGRILAGSDGASFVLKDEDLCYYFDENAISPLWKGRKFPASSCISGWAMTHKQAVLIRDIYKDERIPHDAYRPTFVKSLCMVPVREINPIAAIGNYWSHEYTPTPEQLKELQILANLTAVSIEKTLMSDRLRDELANKNGLDLRYKELEAQLHSIVHDLKNPLTTLALLVPGFRYGLDEETLDIVEETVQRMSRQIDKMLSLYRLSSYSLNRAPTDLSEIFDKLVSQMVRVYPNPETRTEITPGGIADCDGSLMTIVMENLLTNSFKFSKEGTPRFLSFSYEKKASEIVFAVRDNGIGFQTELAKNLFKPMIRLQNSEKYPGTGLGLASSAKIIEAHGGRAWADSEPSVGSTFFFSLPILQHPFGSHF